MKRLAILSFQYYRLLLVYNAVFTTLILVLFGFPSFNINSGSFLFAKIVGGVSAGALYYYMSKESYFYFRNAGYNMWRIHLNAFVIDMIIYALLILIMYVCTRS